MINLQFTTVVYPTNYRPIEGLTAKDVYNAVSKYFKIPDFTGPSRKRELVYARHVFCYISRKHTKETWDNISFFIGGRDHTTAIHSVNKLQDLFDTEDGVKVDVNNIRSMLSLNRPITAEKSYTNFYETDKDETLF